MLLLLSGLVPFCQAQEDRALAYLAAEVRRWKVDNKCFSCHNNGDGARAIYIAGQLGRSVDRDAISETAGWLARPSAWKMTGANPGISDKVLAAIQFAAALKEARFPDRTSLIEAADVLAGDQGTDGSWKVDDTASPATYGTALATYMGRSVLEAADAKRYVARIAKTNAWFAALKPTGIPDTAAAVLAGSGSPGFLVGLQNGDGGWGPWKNSPSEAFDTAIAMIALRSVSAAPDAVARGRAFLLRSQQAQGGWTETTRPAGGQSYAQHISTTAWATIALLRTAP
jgi:squalene cyclase